MIVASAGLLSVFAVSVAGSAVWHNNLILCANNLRQVGRGFNIWASDHQGENPWWVPYTEGGSLIPPNQPTPALINVPGLGPAPALLRQNAWVQFAFISQELRIAGALVCPADRGKLRAQNFLGTNGYFSAGFQDRATSYIIGLHAFRLYPNSILSGDRTIKESGGNVGCSANIRSTFWVPRSSPSGWQPGLHPSGGNLLLNDGHVEGLSEPGLAGFLSLTATSELDPRSEHILKP